MNRILTSLLTTSAILAGTIAPRGHADPVVVPDALKQRVEKEGWSQKWHDELYSHKDPALGAAVRKMLRAKRDAEALKSGLVVHEWGSMQHHVGTTTSELDLLGEDQSDLPPFVQVWADQPVQQPQIIKKPIIYFYTQQRQKVNVTVRFPTGVLTQWYPAVSFFSPMRDHFARPGGNPGPALRNGRLTWYQVDLNPEADTNKFAAVDKNHPWWHTARETDATPVYVSNPNARLAQNREATERFLFYRGAGEYKPMVMPNRNKPGVDLSVTVPFSRINLRGVFLVRVNGSGATITHAPLLLAEGTLNLGGPSQAMPIKDAAKIGKAQLTDSLEAAGLFPKEAAGLVKIWGDDMFTTPGERLLYLMPDNEVERLLPLDIQPKPSSTVRTLIGWVELSTPEAEKRIMGLVKQLGSVDPKQVDAADKELRRLDRFAEAILKRLVDTQSDPAVQQRIKQILNALEQERRRGKALSPGK